MTRPTMPTARAATRSTRRPSARRMLVMLALGTLLAAPLCDAREPDDAMLEALERAYYDLEVARYCGLANDAVGAGFRAEVRRITAGVAIPPATLDSVRGNAWKEAHWQWQDHGLGGYRAWCRDEGRAAAERFMRPHPRPPE